MELLGRLLDVRKTGCRLTTGLDSVCSLCGDLWRLLTERLEALALPLLITPSDWLFDSANCRDLSCLCQAPAYTCQVSMY